MKRDRLKSRGRTSAPWFVGGALAATVAFAAVSATQANPPGGQTSEPVPTGLTALTDPGALPQGGAPAPGEPCTGAVKVDLTRASESGEVEANGKAAVLPAKDVAEAVDAWTCGDGYPTVKFETFVLNYDDGWGGVDLDKKFTDWAKTKGGTLSVVGKAQMYVNQGDPKAATRSVGYAVLGDLMVSAVASTPEASSADLQAVLESVVENMS